MIKIFRNQMYFIKKSPFSKWQIVILMTFIIFLTNCTIYTFPEHEPIYPANGEDVTFTIKANCSKGIANVRLLELVSTIDAAATVTTGIEILLEEWNPTGSPNTVNLSHTKTGGYSANKLVRYTFIVENSSGNTRIHHVTFAIRPYPVAAQPAPVFVQGDENYVYDIIFIPDVDIRDLAAFRSHCKNMIFDAVFAEPKIQPWNRQFNFYINPETGTSEDCGLPHQRPTNWTNLSFAEIKVLMHQNDLCDHAYNGLFSTEQQNRGTMMHEGGHGMFSLADEYAGGGHWEEAILPNNWDFLADAQADAPSRHKNTGDAVEIGETDWYKICDNSCQMKLSGLNRNDYDDPCGDRVIYMIIYTAMNP